MKHTRPMPPLDMLDGEGDSFRPDLRLWSWADLTFLEPSSKLYNPEHDHLRSATIGFVWAAVDNKRAGRQIIGQCEMPGNMKAGKWLKGRIEQQLLHWFAAVPDFIITLDAEYCSTCSDAEFCALVEHEMLHAGQARDEFGAPKFSKSGQPVFAMRGHDVEEFVSIVRRYGAVAAHVEELIAAGTEKPQIAQVHIAQACGTCKLRVA